MGIKSVEGRAMQDCTLSSWRFLAFDAMLDCVLGRTLRTWCAWSKGQGLYPYFVAV